MTFPHFSSINFKNESGVPTKMVISNLSKSVLLQVGLDL